MPTFNPNTGRQSFFTRSGFNAKQAKHSRQQNWNVNGVPLTDANVSSNVKSKTASPQHSGALKTR